MSIIKKDKRYYFEETYYHTDIYKNEIPTKSYTNTQSVNILGTTYQIILGIKVQNTELNDCDGCCDKTSHKIVVESMPDEYYDIDNYEVYLKKILRHEIIHAYLYESGLQENWEHPNRFGHDETSVDWLAIQFPKIYRTFKQLDILN